MGQKGKKIHLIACTFSTACQYNPLQSFNMAPNVARHLQAYTIPLMLFSARTNSIDSWSLLKFECALPTTVSSALNSSKFLKSLNKSSSYIPLSGTNHIHH